MAPPDLRGVDVDVHQAYPRRQRRTRAPSEQAEHRHADGKYHVVAAQHLADACGEPRHRTRPQRIPGGHCHARRERLAPHECAQAARKLRHRATGLRVGHAVAHEDHRIVRPGEQARGGGDRLCARRRQGTRCARQCGKRGRRPGLGLQGHREHGWARRWPERTAHRGIEHGTEIGGVVHLLGEPRNGARHPCDLPAQEWRPGQHSRQLLAHDHQQGNARAGRVQHAAHGVGHARLHVHQRHAQPAGGLRVAIGHAHHRGLGEAQHEPGCPGAREGIHEGQLRAARIPEDDLDALRDERVEQGIGSGHRPTCRPRRRSAGRTGTR